MENQVARRITGEDAIIVVCYVVPEDGVVVSKETDAMRAVICYVVSPYAVARGRNGEGDALVVVCQVVSEDGVARGGVEQMPS